MLANDRQRLELAFSLLFSLPGTPMMQYGDEIGMGDDLSLPERECPRTPMQWTDERHGGFSRADEVVRPVIDDPPHGYRQVNVAHQKRDRNSLLNWTERMIRARQECPQIGWGTYRVLRTSVPEVLLLRYDWRNTALVTLHNFSARSQRVQFTLEGEGTERLVSVFEQEESRADARGTHEITLDPHGYRWLHVGNADLALNRAPF